MYNVFHQLTNWRDHMNLVICTVDRAVINNKRHPIQRRKTLRQHVCDHQGISILELNQQIKTRSWCGGTWIESEDKLTITFKFEGGYIRYYFE